MILSSHIRTLQMNLDSIDLLEFAQTRKSFYSFTAQPAADLRWMIMNKNNTPTPKLSL